MSAAVERSPSGPPPAELLFFWDYDTQWGGDRSRSPGGRKEWGALEFPNTDRLLEIHARFGLPACFAVVGAAAQPGDRPYHDPEQIRRIHAAGHEVGSHAFRHEWLPGLSRAALFQTLRDSREALEQCIGSAVTCFVPPYNQPFDHPRGTSISLSERRHGNRERMNLTQLCRALSETGYRFCRVAYRPAWQRLAERVGRHRLDVPSRPQQIGGVTCVRLNSPGGFAAAALETLDRCVRRGGIAVIWGHPHSLSLDGPQNEAHLVPLLERIDVLRRSGSIRPVLPRELVARVDA